MTDKLLTKRRKNTTNGYKTTKRDVKQPQREAKLLQVDRKPL